MANSYLHILLLELFGWNFQQAFGSFNGRLQSFLLRPTILSPQSPINTLSPLYSLPLYLIPLHVQIAIDDRLRRGIEDCFDSGENIRGFCSSP